MRADFNDLLRPMTPRLLMMVLGCASLLAVTACTHDDDPPQRPIGFRPPVKNRPLVQEPVDTGIPDEGIPPQPTPSPRQHTTHIPQEVASSNASAGPVDYPYGVPVKDKPGFVTSPYAPDSGYVDIHGYATGQEVRDPYTQKIFLVP